MRPNGQRDQASTPGTQPGSDGAHHHPLDDDAELEHIGRFAPPEIDVAPDSTCPDTKIRAGYDAPPPMIRPKGEPRRSAHIEHIAPLGPLAEREGDEEDTPLAPVEQPSGRKIHAFEQKLGGGGHESRWKRQPNVTGTGAIHVKSFHCKLTGDSLEFLDAQINQWLDDHPEYEVKQVTTSIGVWTGKLKEPALIVNVWV